MKSRDTQKGAGRLPRRRRHGATPLSDEHSAAESNFVTIAAVADLLAICDRTVCRWIDREELVAHDFGTITRIGAADLRTFIGRARRGPRARHPSDPLDDEFYTARQVAETLSICVRTVRRRIDSEVLAAHDFNGIIRIARSDLDDFVSRSRRD